MVGEDPQRPGDRLVLAVVAAGERLAELDERTEVVGLVDRRNVLEDRRKPVEAEPGVDVAARQRCEGAVVMELVLHEDEVPELEEALGVVAGTVAGRAESLAAVVVELRARPAWSARPGLPEVVLSSELDDPLVRDADRMPALDRLLVRPEAELRVSAEDGHPDALRGEAPAAGRQLERPVDGLALEVVAEGEVAEHLEERQVTRRHPDVLDVDRSKALLARGEARMRRPLLAAEVGLEGLHARRRQQHRRVVGGGDQRRRRLAQMAALLEERQVALADLGGVHGGQSSRAPGPFFAGAGRVRAGAVVARPIKFSAHLPK